MPQIVIAQVQGMATAAGCQLVCACDLAVCSDDAQFGVSGIRVGLFCATPSVELSHTVVHSKHSLHMLLTGDFISAETARQYGIVNTIVPSEQLHDATRCLAESIVEKSAVAVRLGKELFYKQREAKSVPEAYDMATECMVSNVMHSSQDVKEGIDTFLEKRKPTWQSK